MGTLVTIFGLTMVTFVCAIVLVFTEYAGYLLTGAALLALVTIICRTIVEVRAKKE